MATDLAAGNQIAPTVGATIAVTQDIPAALVVAVLVPPAVMVSSTAVNITTKFIHHIGKHDWLLQMDSMASVRNDL